MSWGVPKIGALATPVASGNLTLAEPAGIAQGDLMVACIAYRSNAAFTVPGDWNLVATQQSSGDTDATNGIASGLMMWCLRGASAPTLTFTRTGGDMATGRILAYTGAHPTTPFDAGTANTLATASATNTTGSITTATPNELIVAMSSAGDNLTHSAFDAATDPTTASGATDTTNPPTAGTWRERSDDGTGTGADGALAIADAVRATAGATGTIQVTVSAAARHVMIAAAFKPGPVNASATDGATATDSATVAHTKAAVGTDGAVAADQGVAPITGFPEQIDRTGGNSGANTTSHVINLPPGSDVIGRLVIAILSVDGGSNTTLTWPGGWTQIHRGNATTVLAVEVRYRFTDGTEGYTGAGDTITVTSNNSEGSSHQTRSYDNADPARPPEAGTIATGVSANPAPPALSPSGGSQKYCWLAYIAADGNIDVTGYPSGYAETQKNRWGNVDGTSTAGAERLLEAASETPGTFTLADAVHRWLANTIAIYPAPAAATWDKAGTDGAKGTDTATATRGQSAAGTDGAKGTDTGSAAGSGYHPAGTDGAKATDASSVTRLAVPAGTDGAKGTDSGSARGTFPRAGTDGAKGTDAATAARGQVATGTDGAKATDTATATLGGPIAKSGTDGAKAADTSSAAGSGYHPAGTDGAKATDASSVTRLAVPAGTDGAKASDSSSAKGIFPRAGTDGAKATDTATATRTQRPAGTDGAKATDAATSQVGGAIGKSGTDGATASDAASAVGSSYHPAGADGAKGSDAATAQRVTRAAATDGARGADAGTSRGEFAAGAADLAFASDAGAATAVMVLAATEVAIASDTALSQIGALRELRSVSASGPSLAGLASSSPTLAGLMCSGPTDEGVTP